MWCLTSTTDTEGETVTLTEVSDVGTFRGSISTGMHLEFLVDEDLLEDRLFSFVRISRS